MENTQLMSKKGKATWGAIVVFTAFLGSILALAFYEWVLSPTLQGSGDEIIQTLPKGQEEIVLAHKLDSGVTDDGLAEIAARHPNIRQLSITQCPRITNEGVRHIGALSHLERLILQGRSGFDEAALGYIVGCPKLSELSIAGLDVSLVGAKHIVKLVELKILKVTRERVSKSAEEYIEKHRPDIKIAFV